MFLIKRQLVYLHMLNNSKLLSLFKSLDLTSQEIVLSRLQQEYELQTPILEKAKEA